MGELCIIIIHCLWFGLGFHKWIRSNKEHFKPSKHSSPRFFALRTTLCIIESVHLFNYPFIVYCIWSLYSLFLDNGGEQRGGDGRQVLSRTGRGLVSVGQFIFDHFHFLVLVIFPFFDSLGYCVLPVTVYVVICGVFPLSLIFELTRHYVPKLFELNLLFLTQAHIAGLYEDRLQSLEMFRQSLTYKPTVSVRLFFVLRMIQGDMLFF